MPRPGIPGHRVVSGRSLVISHQLGRGTERTGVRPIDGVGAPVQVHNPPMQDFRQLTVWQRAHAFAVDVRRATRAFPRTGYSELKSQITRAADSIASNVVEGTAAATRKEFARYLDISIKSTSEVDYRLELARDSGVLPYREWRRLATEVVEIRKMLYALRRAILAAARPIESTPPKQANPMPTDEEAGDHTRGPGTDD